MSAHTGGDLDGCATDSAEAAVDEDVLSRLESAGPGDRLVGGEADDGQGGGSGDGESLGLVGDGSLVGDHEVRERPGLPERCPTEHLVTDPQTGDTLSDPFDDAGEVVADTAGERPTRHGPHLAVAHLPVHGVRGGCADAHQDLAAARRGGVDVVQDEDVGAAVAVVLHASHRVLLVALSPWRDSAHPVPMTVRMGMA